MGSLDTVNQSLGVTQQWSEDLHAEPETKQRMKYDKFEKIRKLWNLTIITQLIMVDVGCFRNCFIELISLKVFALG